MLASSSTIRARVKPEGSNVPVRNRCRRRIGIGLVDRVCVAVGCQPSCIRRRISTELVGSCSSRMLAIVFAGVTARDLIGAGQYGVGR